MALKDPGLYADLDKKANDLLTKDFPDKHVLEVKTKTLSGVNFDAKLTRNNDGSIFGSLYPKYKLGTRIPITVGAQIDTKRALKVEATAEDIVPGLKASVTAHADTESVTVDTEYKHEYVTLAAAVNLLSPKGNKVTASAVVGYQGFAVGVSADYVYDKWNTVSGLASYSYADFVTSIFARVNTHTSTQHLGLTYHQRFNPRASIAAEAVMDVNKSSEAPKITVGGSYDLLDTPTTVKGKLDTEGRVGLSYAHRLNKYARLILATSVNTNNFAASGNHTFGLTLSIND